MIIALITVSPIGFKDVLPIFTQPILLLAGVGVGICSSVIPYVCDQLALARLPRATYALLLSLLPASAVIIGISILHQVPTLVEIVGIVFVAIGVLLHKEADTKPRKQVKS
jgi:inner membrane transporter RhtA